MCKMCKISKPQSKTSELTRYPWLYTPVDSSNLRNFTPHLQVVEVHWLFNNFGIFVSCCSTEKKCIYFKGQQGDKVLNCTYGKHWRHFIVSGRTACFWCVTQSLMGPLWECGSNKPTQEKHIRCKWLIRGFAAFVGGFQKQEPLLWATVWRTDREFARVFMWTRSACRLDCLQSLIQGLSGFYISSPWDQFCSTILQIFGGNTDGNWT